MSDTFHMTDSKGHRVDNILLPKICPRCGISLLWNVLDGSPLDVYLSVGGVGALDKEGHFYQCSVREDDINYAVINEISCGSCGKQIYPESKVSE
jgi:hypothetical protein